MSIGVVLAAEAPFPEPGCRWLYLVTCPHDVHLIETDPHEPWLALYADEYSVQAKRFPTWEEAHSGVGKHMHGEIVHEFGNRSFVTLAVSVLEGMGRYSSWTTAWTA